LVRGRESCGSATSEWLLLSKVRRKQREDRKKCLYWDVVGGAGLDPAGPVFALHSWHRC